MSVPKQVIILRKDLNMRKGKMVAQGCHASSKVCVQLYDSKTNYEGYPDGSVFWEWWHGAQTKICVSVDSEDQLVQLYKEAEAQGLPCSIITDAGHTEFNGVPTKTAVAIGPDYPEKIDPLTKHLKLL